MERVSNTESPFRFTKITLESNEKPLPLSMMCLDQSYELTNDTFMPGIIKMFESKLQV